MIEILYEDWQSPVFFSFNTEEWMNDICDKHGKELAELCIVFCSDGYLLEKNREILNHDYYTDIITLDYCIDNQIFGDLFISLDRVAENAKDRGESFEDERDRVMAHGLLHLVGFGDKTESEALEMRKQEEMCLSLRKI